MFKAYQEQDRVVLDLIHRRRDIILNCSEALDMATALEDLATLAERVEAIDPSLIKGDSWECRVQSYDGGVALRFYPPYVGAPTVIKLPPKAARQLASKIRCEESFARYKMRLVLTGV